MPHIKNMLLCFCALFCWSQLQAEILVDLNVKISYTSDLPQESLRVGGYFLQHPFASSRPDQDFYFEDTLLPGATRVYTLKGPPQIVGAFQLGPDLRLPFALHQDEIPHLRIHAATNGELQIELADSYRKIADYIAAHWTLQGVDYSPDFFIDSVQIAEDRELDKLGELPDWFKQYQAKRIRVFYAQSLLWYNRNQPHRSAELSRLLQDEDLIYDRLYHRYLSTWLQFTYQDDWELLGESRAEKEIRAIILDDHISQRIKDAFLLREAMELDGSKSHMGSGLEDLALSGIRNQAYHNYFREQEWVRPLNKGGMSFDFELMDRSNEPHRLSEYRGKVVLLSFWFPNCTSCLAEFDAEAELYAHYAEQDFELIGICTRSDVATWKSILDSHQVPYNSLFVPEEKLAEIEQAFLINTYPNFVLIDRQGRIWKDKCRRPSDPKLRDTINDAIRAPQ